MNEEYDVIVLGTGLTVSCGGRRGDVSGRPLPGPGVRAGLIGVREPRPRPNCRCLHPLGDRPHSPRVGSGEGRRGLLGCSDLKASLVC